MPIIQSAIKRDRQAKKRRIHNVAVKSDIKKKSKTFYTLIDSKETTKAHETLAAAIKAIDKAATRHILHKNTAARRKSQLTRAYNDISKKPFGTETTTKKPAAAKAAPAKVKPETTAKKAPAKKPAPKKS